jgi:multiple sugar transport system substrate-binding protein
MTWDEANELGAKLTRNDGTQQFVGLSSSGTHMLMMNQLSIPFIDPKTEKSTLFTNERWKKYYEKAFFEAAKATGYIDFMKAHKNSTPYRNEFLKDRNLAMFGWLSSIIFVFPEDYQKMNWDEVSLPTFSDLPKVGSQSYPTYFSVTNMSKHKDAAMDVITYLTTDEIQTKLSKIGVMPVLTNDSVKKVFGQDSAFKDKNLKAAFFNKFAPIAPKSDYDSLALSPYTHAIADSITSGDVNTTFRKAAEKVDKAISDAKAAK